MLGAYARADCEVFGAKIALRYSLGVVRSPGSSWCALGRLLGSLLDRSLAALGRLLSALDRPEAAKIAPRDPQEAP